MIPGEASASSAHLPRAIVVGAGLAGLSAGYRLQQAGFAVTILEKQHRVGGRVTTLRRDGFVIDTGPDAMAESYENYRELAAEIGLGGDFVASSPVVGTIRNGRVIDIDFRKPLQAMFVPVLSLGGKLRLIAGLFRIRKWFAGVNSFRLVDCAALDSESDSALTFSERHFGREVTDYVMDPLMRLTVGSGAAQASRLGILGALLNWSVGLINLKGGLETFPQRLAERLDVRLGATVDHVEETPTDVAIAYRDESGALMTTRADVCVVATTHDVTEQIFPAAQAYVPGYLEQLRYCRFLSVSLAYSRVPTSQAYVIQVPSVENRDVLLIFLQHNKAPDRVPPGHALITFYTDTLATPNYLDKSDEEITAWARPQIEALFPEIAGSFEFSHVSRWPLAGYLATPGFWARTRKLLDAIPQTSRIQIAGDIFGAGSQESAVTWGKRAAQRLVQYHAPSTGFMGTVPISGGATSPD